MKHIFITLMLAAFTPHALGAEVFSTIDEYIDRATGKPDWEVDTVSYRSKEGILVFGAATEKAHADSHPDSRTSIIFILKKQLDGKFSEIVRSKPFFGISDANVENIEAQSNRRFSIQINGHSACGGNVSIHYFEKVGKIWQVSGHDNTTCDCGDADEAVCDTRTTRLTDFLTGDFIKEEFQSNKLISRKHKKLQFKKILLANFENEYNEKYWEQ